MEQTKHNEEKTENPIKSVLVWDLPTRLSNSYRGV
jgi:hypothetical protein